ncbi:MAG: hypothetical protein JWR21_3309 [Herminiimonas sp.]|nr:hypothetical protein [Herminiimonas sp.]
MKHSPSLEEERQALLAQIQSSRAVYRRMLAEADAPEPAGPSAASRRGNAIAATVTDRAESAMQWAKAHPALVAAGAAGLVAVLMLARRRTTRRTASRAQVRDVVQTRGNQLLNQQSAVPRVARGVLMSSLAGLAQGVLRNPARLRLAARAMPVVMGYVRRWRSNAAARKAEARHNAQMARNRQRGSMPDSRSSY